MSNEDIVISDEQREESKQLIRCLPFMSTTAPVTESEALMLLQLSEDSGSSLPSDIRSQVEPLVIRSIAQLELLPDQPDTFTVSQNELRGLIARAALNASAQTLKTIATSLQENQRLEFLFSGSAESSPDISST